MPKYAYRKKTAYGAARRYGARPAMKKSFKPWRGKGTWNRPLVGKSMFGLSTRPITRIVKQPSDLVPDRLFVPLRYILSIPSAATTALQAFYLYASSPLDCGIANDTTSAYGYTRMMALYNRWRVWGSKIKVTMSQASASTTLNDHVYCVVFPGVTSQNNPTMGSYQEAIEQPFSVYGVLPIAANITSTTSGINTQPLILNNKMDMRKLNGITKAELLSPDYSGLISTQPTRVSTWIITTIGQLATQPANAWSLLVEIEYLTEFFNRSEFDVAGRKKATSVIEKDETTEWLALDQDVRMLKIDQKDSKVEKTVEKTQPKDCKASAFLVPNPLTR